MGDLTSDLSVYLKSEFKNLIKKEPPKNDLHLVSKVDNTKRQKSARIKAACYARNIAINFTPNNRKILKKQPEKEQAKEPEKSKGKMAVEKLSDRLVELAMWKARRDKKNQELKAKKKPVFKVCHVPNETAPPPPFAPPNHKFKAPSNIEPINFTNSIQRSVKPSLVKKATQGNQSTNDTVGEGRMMTRSRAANLKSAGSTDDRRKIANTNKYEVGPLKKSATTSMKKQPQSPKPNNVKKEKVTTTNIVAKERLKPPVPSAASDDKVRNETREKSGTKLMKKQPKSPKHKNVIKEKVSKIKIIAKELVKPLAPISVSSDDEVPKEKSGTKLIKKQSKSPKHKNVIKQEVSKSKHVKPFAPISVSSDDEVLKDSIDDHLNISRSSTSTSKYQSALGSQVSSPKSDLEELHNSTFTKSISSPHKRLSSDISTVTPQKTEAPIYISPFVTISRGKTSARKEYHERKSGVGDFSQYTSPNAGAKYFGHRLETEIERLESMCEQWDSYKAGGGIPEEATSMIDVAIGQSRLLIAKKFQQFRGLLNECVNGSADKPVTCEDLHGFWDMMYMQVRNLDQRFENLDRLRTNNWEEVRNEPKIEVKKKAKGKNERKKVQATSKLRDAIKAARLQRQNAVKLEDSLVNVEIVGKVKTPNRKRSSVLASLQCGESRGRLSSPGLMMMKVSQIVKTFDSATPAKSILKTESKSTVKRAKNVLFKDHSLSEKCNRSGENESENNVNKPNTSFSPVSPNAKPYKRRSSRLTRAKLF